MPVFWASEPASKVDGYLVGSACRVFSVCSAAQPSAEKVGYVIDSGDLRLSQFPDRSVIFVSEIPSVATSSSFIVVLNPRLAFAKVSWELAHDDLEPGIHPSVIIHPAASLDPSVRVCAFCVIERSRDLAPGVVINHGTVPKRGTSIGKDSKIGSHTTVGSIGFGFERDTDGIPLRIAHKGNVEIDESVEIGSHVKIHDYVFVAHNEFIGDRALVIAGSEISRSVKVGSNCWIAPGATIIQ